MDIQKLGCAQLIYELIRHRANLGGDEEYEAKEDSPPCPPIILGPDVGQELLDDDPVTLALLSSRRVSVFVFWLCVFGGLCGSLLYLLF